MDRDSGKVYNPNMKEHALHATAEFAENYIYEPLPTTTSIRVLRVDKKGDDGLIHCSIKSVDLNDRPWYHALSYTWRNPHADIAHVRDTHEAYDRRYPSDHRETITINGRVLRVSRNAYDALISIPENAWVDRCNRRNPHKQLRTSLHWASIAGKQELVEPLLSAKVDVNVRDEWGVTPLSYAAQVGSLEAVELLLAAGADVSIADNRQNTPLDYARMRNYPELIQRLEEVGKQGGNLSPNLKSWRDGPQKWVWIDQICIDQNNIKERGSQVSIMDRIYDSAHFTLIWLGPEDSYTETAIQTILKLDSACGDFIHASEIKPYTDQAKDLYDKAQIPYISLNEWNALAVLFLRPYFRRVWIFQENILSGCKLGYCGTFEVPWEPFCRVAQQVYFRQLLMGYTTSNRFIDSQSAVRAIESEVVYLVQWRDRLISGDEAAMPKEISLENLVFDTWTFLAADPRDKIFGLYGLLNKIGGTRLADVHWQPDYAKPVEEVYAEATKEMMQRSGELRMLSAVLDRSLRKLKDLPSWVPDYSVPFCNMMCVNFNAARNLPQKLIRFSSWDRLGVSGVMIDSVLQVGNSTSGPRLLTTVVDHRWFELVLLLPSLYHTGQSRTETLWRTLCADQTVDGSTPAPTDYGTFFRTMLCNFACVKAEETAREAEKDPLSVVVLEDALYHVRKVWSEPPISELSQVELQRTVGDPDTNLSGPNYQTLTHLLYKLQFLAVTEENPWTPTINEVEECYRSRSWRTREDSRFDPLKREWTEFYRALRSSRRRLFVTARRYLGLGPAAMAEGDEIWVLPRSGATFVLRKTDNERSFQLVGEAYVHGVMNGEAVEKLSAADLCDIDLI